MWVLLNQLLPDLSQRFSAGGAQQELPQQLAASGALQQKRSNSSLLAGPSTGYCTRSPEPGRR